MSYYRRHDASRYVAGTFSGTSRSVPLSYGVDLSFRSRPPQGVKVQAVADSSAEPYSWFESYQDLKERAAARTDPSLVSQFHADKGHNWDSQKFEYTGQLLTASASHPQYGTAHLVNLMPRPVAAALPDWRSFAPDTELSNFAALEYARMTPSSDSFSIPAFVGELREGLPGLIPQLFIQHPKGWGNRLQASARKVRDAGSEYLNVQFGWLPLLNDVRQLATALARATVALTGPGSSSYRERMEKPIDTTSIVEYPNGTSWGLGFTPPSAFNGLGLPDPVIGSSTHARYDATWIARYESRQWIQAEFVRLPALGPKRNWAEAQMARYDELMRFDLTPSDLWQLSPWSWLVDWFFNIGGLIDAWQAATSSRTLSTYAYAMREEKRTLSCFVSNIRATSDGYTYKGPRSLFGQYHATRKRRLRANPFGFILNPSVSLNGGQLAILGALGLTNVRARNN